MKWREYEPLKDKTTLRVGGSARYFVDTDDIQAAVSFGKEKDLPIFILGGGSNVVLPDGDVDAVVISPAHTSIEILSDTDEEVVIRVGAACVLDTFIQYTVDRGWWGLENLSFIPGSVAGLVVQNVGAYGTEAKEHIQEVSVFDIEENAYKVYTNAACNFGYRKSIFNTDKKGVYVITHVTLRLSKKPKPVLSYRGVAECIKNTSQQHIRDTIIAIRKEKDLDPDRVWSVGSFFKNVEVKDISHLPEVIQEKCFKTGVGYKIPSGALIEHAGLKGFCVNDAFVSSTQANMLINTGNASQKDFKDLYIHVCGVVEQKFNARLTHEPEFVDVQNMYG